MGLCDVVKQENTPEPQKFVPVNEKTSSRRQKSKLQSSRSVRKVRIICNDPDATDSSDDDAGALEMKRKRFVLEVYVPIHAPSRASNAPKKETLTQRSNNGEINLKKTRVAPTEASRMPGSSRKYRGVRQRKWGKWAAEIRDPFLHKRVWLGTYNSAEEASRAYETKRMEFEALANSIESNSTKNLNDAYKKTPFPVVNSGNLKQNPNVPEKSSSIALPTSRPSPSLAVEMDYVISGPVMKVNSENEKVEEVFVGASGVTDEELLSLAQIDQELNLDLDLDSLPPCDDVFGIPVDDSEFGFEDLPLCGFKDGDQPCELPDFDFDFDFDACDETFSWMDEAPPLKNAPPLNVGCP